VRLVAFVRSRARYNSLAMIPRRALSAPTSPFVFLIFPILAVILFAFVSSGCEHSDLPRDPGDYAIQNNEIRFDGQNYVFRWIGRDGSIHPAKDDDIKMAQDESTFLRVDSSASTLHLAANQSIGVDARDQRGNFGTMWYPFFFGSPFGGPVIIVPPGTGGDTRSPTYRYPPTDTFGRDDSLGGSIPSSRPTPPDYTRVPNARDTVGGQSGGTGGGAAATGKDVSPTGGQAGGVGSGSAAASKGGFRTGPSAYSETRGSPSSSVGGGGATGAGSSGALKSPSAGSGAKTSPAKPSTGSKGIGGGRSGGGRR
jgi:hypothetical protein